jgi:hypothetical protein
MYCANPECPDFKETGSHGEYVEGVTVCPFCGSDLVEQLPKLRPPEDRDEMGQTEDEQGAIDDVDEELVVIATYNSRPDAELMMTYLGNEGIDVFESPDDCGGTNPAIGFGMGIRLLVPKSQAEQASALINEMEKDS